MDNSVEVGTARLGHLFDGDPHTPHTSALLRRDERRIWLEIPWREASDYHRSWFVGLDDRGTGARPVPRSVVFEDSKGPVVLAGLAPWRSSHNLMSDVGLGHMRVDYVVPGTRSKADFIAPTGLRSNVHGLGTFIRDRAITVDYESDRASGRVLTLLLDERDAIELDNHRGLSLVRGFRHSPKDFDLHEVAGTFAIKTVFPDPTPLETHLRPHRAIQSLLGVAYGYPAGFTAHAVTIDPTGPSSHRVEWHELVTTRTGIGANEPLPTGALPLFTFNEVGPAGLREWLRLWDAWPRAMLPLAAMVRMRSNLLEAQFVTLGIGLEALGYYLAVQSGKTASAADDLPLEKKLHLILRDSPFAEGVVGSNWSRRTRDLYTQLKHPTYDYPDMAEAFELLNQSVKLFRLWVADKLGVQVDERRIKSAN